MAKVFLCVLARKDGALSFAHAVRRVHRHLSQRVKYCAKLSLLSLRSSEEGAWSRLSKQLVPLSRSLEHLSPVSPKYLQQGVCIFLQLRSCSVYWLMMHPTHTHTTLTGSFKGLKYNPKRSLEGDRSLFMTELIINKSL